MSDKINRLIQQASIDKERAERLLEEIQVMDKQIADLTAALAEARDKALEEAAKVADAHASNCLSKLNKKRSDHDLAVFESAASEAQSIAHVVRALKEKP